MCGGDFDDKELSEATEIFDIPCVTGEWVRASIRLGHLACPKIYHPIPGGLFQTVVAAIAQLNAIDRKKLYALITFHGGRVERNFTPKTTHLVCGIATGNIYVKAMAMKSDTFSIVTPDWFYECLTAQEIIDPVPYHPRYLKPATQNYHSTDMRSLSRILGSIDDIKSDAKKQENRPKASTEVISKVTDQKSSANSTTTATATATTTISIGAEKPKLEPLQIKPIETVLTMQKNQPIQSATGQSKPMESTIKEKVVSIFNVCVSGRSINFAHFKRFQETQQAQLMAQASKPNTPSTTPTSTPNQTPAATPTATPTPTTPVQTQFLQKQLEQPLKMDNNQHMTIQQVQQNPVQIQQFQITAQPQPQQKPPSNVSHKFAVLSHVLVSSVDGIAFPFENQRRKCTFTNALSTTILWFMLSVYYLFIVWQISLWLMILDKHLAICFREMFMFNVTPSHLNATLN